MIITLTVLLVLGLGYFLWQLVRAKCSNDSNSDEEISLDSVDRVKFESAPGQVQNNVPNDNVGIPRNNNHSEFRIRTPDGSRQQPMNQPRPPYNPDVPNADSHAPSPQNTNDDEETCLFTPYPPQNAVEGDQRQPIYPPTYSAEGDQRQPSYSPSSTGYVDHRLPQGTSLPVDHYDNQHSRYQTVNVSNYQVQSESKFHTKTEVENIKLTSENVPHCYQSNHKQQTDASFSKVF